jgi:hypothetical protein
MNALFILTALIFLFQLWWLAAHLVAYRQTNESLYLFQVFQGGAFALLFGYATIVFFNNHVLNLPISGLLLIAGLIPSILWRNRGGTQTMARHYPRGLRDLLGFRRPAADLKRRVRSK